MKVVILAGGFGTRLAEQNHPIPKPMVEIGGRPLLWHIMQHYARYGHNEFIVCLGYRGDVVKRFFFEQTQFGGDLTIMTGTGTVVQHGAATDDWVVHLVETGIGTGTWGRVKRVRDWLDGEHFMLTYGDGVATVDLDKLIDFHLSSGCVATVTAVRSPARFGGLDLEGGSVVRFGEKRISEGWINGGFMVLSRPVLDHVHSDGDSLETNVLEGLSDQGQLAAFRHEGFWQCMDTPRDVRLLLDLWNSGCPPWKTWT